jgi:hypothetical protein
MKHVLIENLHGHEHLVALWEIEIIEAYTLFTLFPVNANCSAFLGIITAYHFLFGSSY